MSTLLEQSGVTREFVKEAIVAGIVRTGGKLLTKAFNNPLKTLTHGMNAYGTVAGAKVMQDSVRMGKDVGADAARASKAFT